METYWARLAPYNPKLGCVVRRFSCAGSLYIGGERPTWYKVSDEHAALLRPMRQEANNPRSPALFELFSDEQRAAVDSAEEQRYLVQMGIMAATAPMPLSPIQAMDMTQDPRGVPVNAGGRAAAIPAPDLKPLAAEAPPPVKVRAPAPEARGDITTKDLPSKPEKPGRKPSK